MRSENHNAKVMEADKDFNSCLEARDKKSLNYVANNIRALEGISKNKYELLQSERFFTEADKEPLLKFLNETSACRNAYVKKFNAINYKMSLSMKKTSSAVDNQYVKFMQGKINVSQFNSSIEQIWRTGQSNEQIILDEINRKNDIAHNKEVDRSLEAYKADQQVAAARAKNAPPITNWGDVYTDLIKEQNKTTNTNCQVYGNTVNCQSY